ncbi:hypothetical protein HPB52_016675 [Rhipicephalus sanguineus]|uniref:Tick transposon n=1 Tax=Rhipicephalus sanguineus TaxID=34632 RepID=A0A9D4Q747_RHISA|nr:hypothetical protein HPB52_016675 [Rhipicephalus sanguineus]
MLARARARREGMREHDLHRLIDTFVISRPTYSLHYTHLLKSERDKIDVLIRRAYRTALGLPPTRQRNASSAWGYTVPSTSWLKLTVPLKCNAFVFGRLVAGSSLPLATVPLYTHRTTVGRSSSSCHYPITCSRVNVTPAVKFASPYFVTNTPTTQPSFEWTRLVTPRTATPWPSPASRPPHRWLRSRKS